MSHRMLQADDELEAVAMEQARAMVRELKHLANATADGHVLAAVERAAVDLGRRFTRDRLQGALNAQAGGLEQKGGADGIAPAEGYGATTAAPRGGWSPPRAT